MFLAFFFTFLGIFLEVAALWAARHENVAPVREKETRAADAPAAAPAATATA